MSLSCRMSIQCVNFYPPQVLSHLCSHLSKRTNGRYLYPHVSDVKNEALVTKHLA